MSAFFICFVREISDPTKLGKYREAVGDFVLQYGGRLLAACPTCEAGELGTPPIVAVAVHFPSLNAAHDFYDANEYAPLKDLRRSATKSEVYFVESLPNDAYASP